MRAHVISDVERYLTEAEVIGTYTPKLTSGGACATKFSAILEGGVTVLIKPLCAHHEGGLSEVAAWKTACLLGWTDLVPVTVLRSMRCPTHDRVEAVAAIVNIESRDDFPEMSSFSDDDRWRAGVFDFIIAQTDRAGQTNYLGVPSGSSTQRLVLIDNSYAFGANGSSVVRSQFRDALVGQTLPDRLIRDLETFQHVFPLGLGDLILPARASECSSRVAALLAAKTMI